MKPEIVNPPTPQAICDVLARVLSPRFGMQHLQLEPVINQETVNFYRETYGITIPQNKEERYAEQYAAG